MSKNTIRETPAEQAPPPKKTGGGNIVTKTVGSVLSGSFLSREQTVKLLPFIFFLTGMALLYISNGYYAEEQIRKLNSITNELKELRSEYFISKSDLMFVSKQSEVAKRALSIGLKESIEPPKKIIVPVTPEKQIEK